ncbi:glycosyltransferase family 1 protein [Microcoleus sp. herbarium8]|uniref:glycosyltransferase family 1 protein n=1 Tax=Microcoleus sp. herbarium8 TaxID=3055436 RepID=UPI002FD7978C
MSNLQDTFIFNGQELPYNRIEHNNFPCSERAVEIPIACNFLARLNDKTRLLEVGNVLKHYEELIQRDLAEIQARRIIDKYEIADGVDNVDLMELPLSEQYSAIICISTVEHIGQGAEPNQTYGENLDKCDREGPLKAIAQIYDLLSDGGQAFITVPFGKLLERGWFIQFDRDYLNLLFEKYNIPQTAINPSFLKLVQTYYRPTHRSVWVQANPLELSNVEYDAPFSFANAIAVLEITKVAARNANLTLPSIPQKPEQFLLTSKLCVYKDFQTNYYRHWIAQMREEFTPARKQWEFVAIVQALQERKFLGNGKKGLGFAVGNEPLPSLFASLGCEIVATDQGLNPISQKEWGETNQLCKGKEALNAKRICPPEQFDRLVEVRDVDMNYIPEDLKRGQFDFIWSSCAFEHIGSIEKGLQFVQKSLACLKSGGIALHTTEYNCTSNAGTLDLPNLVFYRCQDIDRIIAELEKQGHWVEPVNYELGSDEPDLKVAKPPYTEPHLKLEMGGYVATSLLLIIHKDYYTKTDFSQNVPVVSQATEKPIKIIYDISVLGYGHHLSRSRTGVARVIENIALGLLTSTELELSFAATHSTYAVHNCLDYLESQPIFKDVPFVHPSFIYKLRTKITELYKMLENQSKVLINNGSESENLSLIESLKNPLIQAMNLTLNYNSLDPNILSDTDIFHSTFYHIPDQVRQIKNLKKITTIYDLIPIVLSNLFIGKNDIDYQRMVMSLQSLTPEDSVICISRATRNDLLNHVKNLDPAKVSVSYLAANPNTFYPCYDTNKMAGIRHKYSIPDAQYILGVSTIEPRKNIQHAIRCFAKVVQQQGIKDLYLVLVGALGWDYEQIFAEISQGGLPKDRVIITGYVADEDLAALYSGALAFVYPSLYEGFGLPPLEAMQCGTPVITSNTSSLPEVVGDAGIMLDPQDADGLCHNMLKLYNSPSLRNEMSLKSLKQAQNFSWDRCNQETIAAYQIALSS